MNRFSPEFLNQVEKLACLFPCEDDTQRVPQVEFDSRSAHELPCNAIIPGEGVRIILHPLRVPIEGCIAQRKAGLCPRGFGLTVPENLRARPG